MVRVDAFGGGNDLSISQWVAIEIPKSASLSLYELYGYSDTSTRDGIEERVMPGSALNAEGRWRRERCPWLAVVGHVSIGL